jgi:elongation factor Ts
MAVSAADVKALRERTGAGIMDCKNALNEVDGDLEKAIDFLQVKGIAKAAKKAGRIAADGVVHSYIHTGGKVGVLLEVNCETDFVTKTDAFIGLVNDIALHVAAMNPLFLVEDDIDANTRSKQFELFKAQGVESGKPAKIVEERIVPGKMKKWAAEICLLSQPFVKDSDKTISEVVQEATASIGERIVVRRFTRYELGEGLEKRGVDFAAEVAAVAGA